MRERKPFDPALRSFLDAQTPAPLPTSTEELVKARRNLLDRALASRISIPGLPNDVATRDVTILDELHGRLFTPAGLTTPLPVLVYLHGGGWVAGSVATHEPFCCLLSRAANIIILSVEYRRAPEHPHPAALEDALTAAVWAKDNAAQWGGDATRIALGGDSAGGHLAAAAANRLCRTPGEEFLRALVLLYPVTDHPDANHPSYTENATGYGLEGKLMRWFWDQYAQGAPADDPSVSPLRLHKFPALPPTLIATSEYDVLRDEGIAYGEKLKSSGIPVTQLHAPDMHHNFAVHPATVARFPQSETALHHIAGWLRKTLAPTPTA
jgi:acetyl esterase